MKQFILKCWIAIFLIFIVGFLFYWFQYRPSSIRSVCQKQVDIISEKVKTTTPLSDEEYSKDWDVRHGFASPTFNRQQWLRDHFDKTFTDNEKTFLYQECLQRHGLVK